MGNLVFLNNMETRVRKKVENKYGRKKGEILKENFAHSAIPINKFLFLCFIIIIFSLNFSTVFPPPLQKIKNK